MPCYSLTLMCHLFTNVLHMTTTTMDTPVTWYDNLTEQDQELYEMIEDRCPEFTKLDAEKCQEFMDELSDHGITTAEQFEDAYFYQTDSWNAERDFAQYFAEEIACLDVT